MTNNERAKRYKKVYRIVKNTYQDTKLAKRAQTWSDETLYLELGIKVGRKTPELKKVKKERVPYYKRKYEKFRSARLQNISVDRSKKISTRQYSKKVVKNIKEYEKELNADYLGETSLKKRKALWSGWSKHEGMKRDNEGKYSARDKVRDKLSFPPEIVERAIQRNRDAKHMVNGKLVSMGFDDYDRYGFAFEYFAFIYNDEEKALKIVDPTPYGEETYRDIRKII